MTSIKAVHLRLLVDDMGRAIAFYRDHFGFKVNFSNAAFADLSNGGTITLITRAGLAEALGRDVFPNQTGAGKNTESLLAITVANTDSFCASLSAGGVKLIMSPKRLPEAGMTVAYVEDPDGHVIEINDSPHV